jgi:hypothetical protein
VHAGRPATSTHRSAGPQSTASPRREPVMQGNPSTRTPPAASDGARRPGRGRPWPAGPAPVDQVSVNTLYRHPPNKSTKGQSRELSQTCRYMPSLEFATTFSHAPTGRVE